MEVKILSRHSVSDIECDINSHLVHGWILFSFDMVLDHPKDGKTEMLYCAVVTMD